MKRGFVPVLALLVMAASAASAQAVPHSSAQGLSHRNACGVPAAESARCFAKVVTRDDGSTFNAAPAATTGTPAGWGPADLEAAYNLSDFSGSQPPTVAIVDAYDDPNAASDLAAYRSQYSLPPCGTGCFKKVNQTGAEGSYPSPDSGWAEEISLDLDMVSSACPSCHILLVEANSNSFTDLMKAVDYAATSGAVAVSNSYGANEFSGETTYDSHFNRPGVAITVSSGDNGYGPEYPAASRFVTATGGTSLSKLSSTTGRGWSETAWSGAGSGCSSYETKPQWQGAGACGRRTIADVSSVSNPNTGVAVYDTYGDPGWMVFGGTSAAAPFIAGVYAIGGTKATNAYAAQWPYPYAGTAALNDVTSGSNGRCTTGRKNTSSAYLCTAGTGYDGPTGLGTPNGSLAF